MTPPAAGALTTKEKVLYHQINPFKIATDVSTTVVTAWMLARHELALGLLVMWAPSIAVTATLVHFGDFSKTRDSRAGEYLRRNMTPAMQGVRMGGEFVIAVSSWFHQWSFIAVGAAVIILGWSGKAIAAKRRRGSK